MKPLSGAAVPHPFRELRVLRAMNVLAVGAALGTAVGAVFERLLHPNDYSTGIATACSSLVVGTLWAALLRSRRTIWGASIRVGWVLSVPLAVVNCWLALMLLSASGAPGVPFDAGHQIGVFFFAAVVGWIVWLPALAATLVFFGVPIARAQRLAERGLAGEERGERVVGIASVVVALAGMTCTIDALGESEAEIHWETVELAMGTAGGVLGGAAAWMAHARERRRKAFIARAAAGGEPGYAVRASAEGSVLVRVASGAGDREAAHQALVELDGAGEARRIVG
jgi:hypothetical protein